MYNPSLGIVNGGAITLGDIEMNTIIDPLKTYLYKISSSTVNEVTFNDIKWNTANSTMNGNFTIENLTYKLSSDNIIGANRTITVNDQLIANGANKTLNCNEYPYILSTKGFNSGYVTIKWDDNSTLEDRQVAGPGTYSVEVTYGAGCSLIAKITLGIVANPALNTVTLKVCETASGSAKADFTLTDANAILVTVPLATNRRLLTTC